MNNKKQNRFSKYKFSVILLPEDKSTNSKSFSFNKILTYISIYSICLIILITLIFYLTPVNKLISDNTNTLSKKDKMQLQELNNRVIFLMSELDRIKSINENLKKSILLADSNLNTEFSGNQKEVIKKEEIKKENSQLQLGGNIFYILKKLFFNQSQNSFINLDSAKESKSKILTSEKNITENKEKNLFINPIEGSFISRKYLLEYGHTGIDFPAKEGTPIFASASGFVIFSDYTFDDGNMIIISHNDNYVSIYKHCSLLLKKQRESVYQGEVIALTGNTGKLSTGPHLHFEIWKNGNSIDPQKILLK